MYESRYDQQDRTEHPLTRGSTTVISLGTYPEPLVSALFGRMVELAEGTVVNFRGDLYSDALWIEEFVVKGDVTTFLWGIRPCGTAIGTDPDYVRYGAYYMWQIAITETRGVWHAEFTILHGVGL